LNDYAQSLLDRDPAGSARIVYRDRRARGARLRAVERKAPGMAADRDAADRDLFLHEPDEPGRIVGVGRVWNANNRGGSLAKCLLPRGRISMAPTSICTAAVWFCRASVS